MTVESAHFDSTVRHKWGEPVSIPCSIVTGCEETERTCGICGLVKITVHPPQGFPWREWRTKDGMRAQLTATPPCVVATEEAA